MTERRLGIPARLAATAASLLAIGALMIAGVAVAAFGDDGTGQSAAPAVTCSAVVTTECVPAEPGLPATTAPDSATTEAASTTTTVAAAEATVPAAPAATTEPAPPQTTTAAAGGSTPPATTTGAVQSAAPPAPAAPPPATTTTARPQTTTAPPKTNPLPVTTAPAAPLPVYTGPDGASALAGVVANVPNGKQLTAPSTSGTSVTGSGGTFAVAAGANDIRAIGISALAILQLQAAAHLAPAPTPLPAIAPLGPTLTAQFTEVGKSTRVGWTVLAAIARMESNLGRRGATFAGRRAGISGNAAVSLPRLGAWLAAHGASADASRPFASKDALHAYFRDDALTERAVAVAAYYYAFAGVDADKGLAASQEQLATTVLQQPKRIAVYGGGRADLEQNRIDPRVLMTIRYLEAAFGTVRVSSLISGHAIFAMGGKVSAHVFGRAVDIAALGGTAIEGHQGPGTVTERALRMLLLLPKNVAPRQLISMMDLDGPTGNAGSFALPDHHDRIYIGY